MKKLTPYSRAALCACLFALAGCGSLPAGSTATPAAQSTAAIGDPGTAVVVPDLAPTIVSETAVPTVSSEEAVTVEPTSILPTAEGAATDPAATMPAMGTATPDGTALPDASGSMSSTSLSGSVIEFNGVMFSVDETMIPGVIARTGPVHEGTSASSQMLTGTVLTLNGLTPMSPSSDMLEPRIVVVPVNQYGMMTSTVGQEAGTAMDGDAMGFMTALSDTINGTSNLPSSAMSDTMILTRSMTVGPMTAGPMNGADTLLQTNVKRVDFLDGKGVRFVTAFGSSTSAITNESLYYVYHGLTNDGMYHVSAVLPLSSTVLPDSDSGTVSSPDLAFPSNPDDAQVQTYLDNVMQALDMPDNNGSSFSSRLLTYDQLIGSIDINSDSMP